MYNILIVITIVPIILKISHENINSSPSYSFHFSGMTMNISNQDNIENSTETEIEELSNIFRENLNILKIHTKLDIIFLIDASSSVGQNNFKSELKFVKKVLSDVTVDSNHTRVAVITFSSPSNTIKNVDEISKSLKEQTKCILLNKQFKNITYNGGETFTKGAFQVAKEIFDNASRNDSKKVLFLITDGYSSGGDPAPVADQLKNNNVTIFTIGIESGNFNELHKLSSFPGESYSYLLDSFNEFQSLGRRALHIDLKNGEYIPVHENQPCDVLCRDGDCCDSKAICTCGTTTGHYACICREGYYGSGLKGSCIRCASGTYSDGPNICLPCPDPNHVTIWPSYGPGSCKCKDGYETTRNNECRGLKIY